MLTSKLKVFLSKKRVAIVGLGVSNRPLLKILANWGIEVTAFDKLTTEDPGMKQLVLEYQETAKNVEFVLGEDYLDQLKGFDIIFVTPHFRLDHPVLEAARAEGSIITSEMAIFFALCPASIIAVTGSDGKTTTATLLAELLKAEKRRVHLGGNIGTPLTASLDRIKEDDVVVLELSSFQLMSLSASPEYALITNLTPNHLDFHLDLQEYIDAKKNIYRHQDLFGKLIINGSQEISREFAMEAKGEVIWIEQRQFEAGELFGLNDNELFYQASPAAEKQRLLRRTDLRMTGRHNALNLLMAYAACREWVSEESLLEVASSFVGVEYRCQLIGEKNEVSYYNSSIDSSPERSAVTLNSFEDRGIKTVAIFGGRDKNLNYESLGQAMAKNCRAVLLCGENQELIRLALNDALSEGQSLELRYVPNYKAALQIAENLAEPGDAVVLTPAGTSFDKFRDYRERGENFNAAYRRVIEGIKDC